MLFRSIRELGFNRPCFRGWDKDGKVWYHPDSDIVLDNPTFSQCFRYFREKHGLDKVIYPTLGSKANYYINIFQNYNSENSLYWNCSYETYEEAELECLVKLIEIVKKNECRIEK